MNSSQITTMKDNDKPPQSIMKKTDKSFTPSGLKLYLGFVGKCDFGRVLCNSLIQRWA